MSEDHRLANRDSIIEIADRIKFVLATVTIDVVLLNVVENDLLGWHSTLNQSGSDF